MKENLSMRRILAAVVLCATLLPVAACSGKSAADSANPSAKPSGASGSTGGPSGAPGSPGAGGNTGTASDKAACEAITVKLSAWGGAFADVLTGLASAGNDVNKVKAVVDKAKASNSKYAGELRAVAASTGDAAVKKVATDLAATLEQFNTRLDPNQIAQDPDKMTAMLEAPEYAASAEAYEKVCGAT
jgi:hypothetical protein